ncbi:MAG: hypothetical protein IPH18_18045 [Chitinophagaceae bacterium]|nr:hypothetical protein [Chitinophagaceae bacterium]
MYLFNETGSNPQKQKTGKALRNFLEESAIDFTIAQKMLPYIKQLTQKSSYQTNCFFFGKESCRRPEWQKQFVRKDKNTTPIRELLILKKRHGLLLKVANEDVQAFFLTPAASTYHSDSSLVQRAQRSRAPVLKTALKTELAAIRKSF